MGLRCTRTTGGDGVWPAGGDSVAAVRGSVSAVRGGASAVRGGASAVRDGVRDRRRCWRGVACRPSRGPGGWRLPGVRALRLDRPRRPCVDQGLAGPAAPAAACPDPRTVAAEEQTAPVATPGHPRRHQRRSSRLTALRTWGRPAGAGPPSTGRWQRPPARAPSRRSGGTECRRRRQRRAGGGGRRGVRAGGAGGGAGHLREGGVGEVGSPGGGGGAQVVGLGAHAVELVARDGGQCRLARLTRQRQEHEVAETLQEVLDEAAWVVAGLGHLGSRP